MAPHRTIAPAATILLFVVSPFAAAEVTIGPWTFEDDAFADDAAVLEEGITTTWCAATSVFDALTGYSPDKMLINIGAGEQANHFQLEFLDGLPVNIGGPDIVFFDARFSEDGYAFKVRPVGGAFTDWVSYDASEFIGTGFEACTAEVFGLPIDLSDFDLGPSVFVDALQFRALTTPLGIEQGDPVMAGALHTTPGTPAERRSWGSIKATYRP